MGANCGQACDRCDRRTLDTNAQPDINELRRNNNRSATHLTPIGLSKSNTFTKPVVTSTDDELDRIEIETKLNTAVPSSSSSSDEGSNSHYDTAEPEFEPSSQSKYHDPLEQTPPPSNEEEIKQKAIDGFKNAVEKGKDNLVRDYIEEYPNLNLLSTKFDNDDNCLQVAISNGHSKLALCLLNQGVSPNAANPNNGDTALHTAVRAGDTKMVTLLCKHGATPSIKNKNLETPISIAHDNDYDDIIELLEPEMQSYIREKIVTVRGDKDKDDIIDLRNPAPLHHVMDSDDDNDEEGASFKIEPRITRTLSDSKYSKKRSRPTVSKKTPKHKEKGNNRKLKPKLGFFRGLNSAPDIGIGIGGGDLVDVDTNVMPKVKRSLSSPRTKKLSPKSLSPKNNITSPIAKKSYGKLKRHGTNSTVNAFEKMAKNYSQLPVMEAWLEKKSSQYGIGWQKRWVMIRKNYLLWSDVKRGIKDSDVKDVKERMKFNNSINLICIKEVKAVTPSKSQRKFKVIMEIDGIKKKRREYLFKCASTKDRDFWVDGIKQHVSHMNGTFAYLDQ